MIAIIDYGMGNIASVFNMLKRIGYTDAVFTNDSAVIEKATKLILPGVGSFDNGMMNLEKHNLISVLNKKVIENNTPVLGICLGMQLLTKSSEEGRLNGLGWIDAETVKFNFPDSDLKVPHMGWNYINIEKKSALTTIGEKQKYYFVHSYYVKCNNPNNVLATCDYGGKFSCIINHDNVYGAQFHPEKSHKYGMNFLKKFIEL